jgi:hypothetical protein
MTFLLSALTANRKRFFELVETLERESSCTIDVVRLQGLIDAHFSGRDSLRTPEARELLMAVSDPVTDFPDEQGGAGTRNKL